MKNFLWKCLAYALSREPVANWIIRRSKKTPYYPIMSKNGKDLYMDRWWFWNPYSSDSKLSLVDKNAAKKHKSLPATRVHHIVREDRDRHLHDHPWDARTIILKGWYKEIRLCKPIVEWANEAVVPFTRVRGDTATLNFGEFHQIQEISPGGVYTLFIMFSFRGMWGFLVNGVKVPFTEYAKLIETCEGIDSGVPK